MNITNTHYLLERINNLLRSEARQRLLEYGLQPIQFEVLHYLSICNHYSDTPMGVTEYLGQTKGSISQTLKVLEKKGLIKKETDLKDKRVTHMQVTTAGNQVINQLLPSPLLQIATEKLEKKTSANIEHSLIELLSTIQESNNFKHFGQCKSCKYNLKISSKNYVCGLTNETLSTDDIHYICREHTPKN